MVGTRSDELRVGDRYDTLVLPVTKELNQQFARAVDDFNPRYEKVVHPALLLCYTSITRSSSFFLPPGVQAVGAKMSSEFLRSASVGQTYLIDWLVTDVYEKRARCYQVSQVTVRDEAGQGIWNRVFNTTFVGGEHLARRTLWEHEAHALARASDYCPADRGYQIVGRNKALTLERMNLYSGGSTGPNWPAKNIHTDRDTARRAGLDRPIASGLMFEAYLIELLLDFFGENWLSGGKMKVTYIEPAGEGDTLTPKATIESRQMDARGLMLGMELWCENQAGRRTVVGSAVGCLEHGGC